MRGCHEDAIHRILAPTVSASQVGWVERSEPHHAFPRRPAKFSQANRSGKSPIDLLPTSGWAACPRPGIVYGWLGR